MKTTEHKKIYEQKMKLKAEEEKKQQNQDKKIATDRIVEEEKGMKELIKKELEQKLYNEKLI